MLAKDAHYFARMVRIQDKIFVVSLDPKAIRSCMMLRIYVFKTDGYLCHPLFKSSLSSPLSCSW